MKSLMDKKNIIRNFSKAACVYDKYADVQKLAASELVSRLPKNGFRSILEIGCGTGIYTELLKTKFSGADLRAIDISPEMIGVAKRKFEDNVVNFEVADAESFSSPARYDLITSNACFQWVQDLPAFLKEYKAKLASEGVLSFSIFGPRTYWELDSILKGYNKDISVSAAAFFTKEELDDLLNKNFKSVSIEEVRFCEKFSKLTDLLAKIKYTGTSGQGIEDRKFLGPKRLKELDIVFKEKFGSIIATHQVFFCYCS